MKKLWEYRYEIIVAILGVIVIALIYGYLSERAERTRNERQRAEAERQAEGYRAEAQQAREAFKASLATADTLREQNGQLRAQHEARARELDAQAEALAKLAGQLLAQQVELGRLKAGIKNTPPEEQVGAMCADLRAIGVGLDLCEGR